MCKMRVDIFISTFQQLLDIGEVVCGYAYIRTYTCIIILDKYVQCRE